MKKFFLETRWIGLLAVLAFALVVARLATNAANAFVKENVPDLAAEARNFLPISIENGTIVEPAEALISKTYSDEEGENSFYVVLNTQVDEASLNDLSGNGLYVTRKAVYVVSPEKTECRSLDMLPDMTVDGEKLDSLLSWLEKHLGKYLFVGIAVALFFFVSSAILLYSALAHLLVGMHFPVRFSRTLRITLWTYLVSTALAWFAGLPIGIIVKFILVLLANFVIDKCCRQQTPPPIPPPAP